MLNWKLLSSVHTYRAEKVVKCWKANTIEEAQILKSKFWKNYIYCPHIASFAFSDLLALLFFRLVPLLNKWILSLRFRWRRWYTVYPSPQKHHFFGCWCAILVLRHNSLVFVSIARIPGILIFSSKVNYFEDPRYIRPMLTKTNELMTSSTNMVHQNARCRKRLHQHPII